MPHNFFSRITLFPYSNFGRVDGQEFTGNWLGGVLTIIVLAIASFSSYMKANDTVSQSTFVSNSSSLSVNMIGPMFNITSNKNSGPEYIPYMFGLAFYQDEFYSSSSKVTAEYVQSNGSYISSNRTVTRTTITLQKCTADHFSSIPNIQTKAVEWNISSWLCLPLNATYQIGGLQQLSQIYKRIQINVKCDSSQNLQDCGRGIINTVSRSIDLSGQQPSTYYLHQNSFLVKAQSSYTYSSKLNPNRLIINGDPVSSVKVLNTSSVESEAIVLKEVTAVSAIFQTTLKIQIGQKSFTYNRTYINAVSNKSLTSKLLDFTSVFGSFIYTAMVLGLLVSGFNRHFFEMNFSNHFFNPSSKQKVGLISYLKMTIYEKFQGTCLMPTSEFWQDAKNQRQKIKTANKLLDFLYLNKRIAFLEEALSLLFSKQQIKGLHLMHSITQQQTKSRLQKHQLRQRLIYYIFKAKKEQQQILPLLNFFKQKILAFSNLKNSELIPQKRGKEAVPPNSVNTEFEMIRNGQLNSSKPTIRQPQPGVTNKKRLELEAENISEIQQQVLKEEELVNDLENDLRLFIEEALTGSNPISAQIYSKIEPSLKHELNKLLKQIYDKKRKTREGIISDSVLPHTI